MHGAVTAGLSLPFGIIMRDGKTGIFAGFGDSLA